MNNSDVQHRRIAAMSFASVYPHYVTKVEKKGRTKQELHKVIEWLTGFDETNLLELIQQKADSLLPLRAGHLSLLQHQ